jgi:hypothetical protein
MTTSKEIKKALNKAFKGVKFSVKTENRLCETIIVSWVGGPFINQVKEITNDYHTYQNHSDAMVDYFHCTGTKIEIDRKLSQEEIDFVVPGILSINGRIIDDLQIVFEPLQACFVVPAHPYKYRFIKQNESLKAYHENGMAIELNSREAENAQDDYLLATDPENWTIKHEQKKQEEFKRNEERNEERKKAEINLIKGDYTGSVNDGNLNYITVECHEGAPTIAEGAKFSSFHSVNNAIREIYKKTKWGHAGYDKLNFSIHFLDGKVYKGRLDLSPVEDNCFATENVIGDHCVRFLKKHNDLMLEKYKFSD